MSTTEPIVTDENKTEETENTTDKADWKGFSKNLSYGLITGIFIGVIVIGSTGLFLAKVANANILPTECDIEPYPVIGSEEVTARIVPMEIIYMNPVKIFSFFGLNFWTEPTSYYTQEANFVNADAELNFMNDFKNSWLCSLKNKAYPPLKADITEVITAAETAAVTADTGATAAKSKSWMPNGWFMPKNERNFGKKQDAEGNYVDVDLNELPQYSPFWAYEFETLKKMTVNSFSMINSVFFYMNYLPEWGTMIFFALFFGVIITIIFLANWLYGLWSHLSNFGDLVSNLYNPKRFNKGTTRVTEDPTWYEKGLIFPFFVMGYFICAMYSAIFIGPTMVTLYAFFKALRANYVIRDNNNEKASKDAPKQNLFSFIKSTLYYKKTFLIILVMLNLMGVTNEYLGTSYLPGVIIAILILIFGLKILEVNVPEDLFKVTNANFPPLIQPDVDLLTDQLVNMCSDKPTKIVTDPKIITTVTGFVGSDVLQNVKAEAQSQTVKAEVRSIMPLIGGRPNKKIPKTKTKFYNLKLV